jgi:glycine/D-amino acid oxidase-like deaminating enzyme
MIPFPISEATPITYAGPPPPEADVVVIGGGVIGVSTALFRAEAGKRVVLLEKGRIAGEQSSRNWGWIRQQGRDPDEIAMLTDAKKIWRDLAARTNVDIGLKTGGVTYLAHTEEEIEGYREWMTFAKEHEVDSRILNAADVSELVPNIHGAHVGGIHTPTDMRAEPWVAVPAIAGIAARAGAVIVENCAVRALDMQAGRVAGVVTEAGLIKAPEVVLAGGAWSSLFLRNMGVALPQLSIRATVAATEALPVVHMGGVADKNLAFRPREDGGYSLASGRFIELFVGPDSFRNLPHYLTQLRTDPFGVRFKPMAPKGYPDAWGTPRSWSADTASPFEAMRVLNPSPNKKKVADLAKQFEAMFPHIGPVRIKSAWGGMIDTMPDIVPVMDRVAALPGLTVGTGFSGHGFGIGPAAGRILAALATGVKVRHDLNRFRLSRFSDGSKMRLGPAI